MGLILHLDFTAFSQCSCLGAYSSVKEEGFPASCAFGIVCTEGCASAVCGGASVRVVCVARAGCPRGVRHEPLKNNGAFCAIIAEELDSVC